MYPLQKCTDLDIIGQFACKGRGVTLCIVRVLFFMSLRGKLKCKTCWPNLTFQELGTSYMVANISLELKLLVLANMKEKEKEKEKELVSTLRITQG